MKINNAETVGNYLDVLFFAVRATEPFKLTDLLEAAIDVSTCCASKYVKNLIELGYIEKVTACKYQATNFAKQMFNVTEKGAEIDELNLKLQQAECRHFWVGKSENQYCSKCGKCD